MDIYKGEDKQKNKRPIGEFAMYEQHMLKIYKKPFKYKERGGQRLSEMRAV